MASIETISCLSFFSICVIAVSCTDCQRQASAVAITRRDCPPSCSYNENRCNAPEQCVCDGICGLTCVPIGLENYCEPISDRHHVNISFSPEIISFGTLATSSCESGYERISGDKYRVCGGDGRWGGEDFVCEQLFPCNIELRPTVIYSRLENPRSQYQPGERLHYRCKAGHYPVGLNYITCFYNGTWSEPELHCIGNAICDDEWNPGTISNGHVFMTNEPADNKLFRVGTVLGYVCYHGYRLVGNPTRTCLKSGKWTAIKPKCLNNNVTLGGQLAIDWNVYFIFDASNSISQEYFKKGILFAKRLVSKVGVGPIGLSGARYGAMLLASTPINLFHLSDPFNTVGDVTVALEQAVYFAEKVTKVLGSKTDMQEALVNVENKMLRNTPARPNATSVLFLITDGQSTGDNNLVEIADRLKTEYNFLMFCIGVGSEINEDELSKMASTPLNKHVWFLHDYLYHLYMDGMVDAITKSEKGFECGIGRGPFSANLRGRIVGGNNAGEGAWPWMVGLYHWEFKGALPTFFCGGSLISRFWILTAATCFQSSVFNTEKLPENLIVSAGSNEKLRSLDELFMPTGGLQILQVAEIIKHEQYDQTGTSYDYDIALIRLQTKAVLTRTVNPVCLPAPGLKANTDLLQTGFNNQPPYVTGWGDTRARTPQDRRPVQFSPILQQAAIPLKERITCADSLPDYSDILVTKRMICAGYTVGEQTETGEIRTEPRDSCEGDAGGPLVRARYTNGEDRYFQIGITSWGFGCAQRGRYGFYTHVPLLVSWVNDKTA